jgi:hypothetical protein
VPDTSVLRETCTECEYGEDIEKPYVGFGPWMVDTFRSVVVRVGIDNADQRAYGVV